jgi:hypothetical protein
MSITASRYNLLIKWLRDLLPEELSVLLFASSLITCITLSLFVSNSSAIISGLIPELYRLSIVFLCSEEVDKLNHLSNFKNMIHIEIYLNLVIKVVMAS